MKKRGISEADVEFCLKNHDTAFTPKEGYILYFADHPNGKRIQVVFDPKSNEIVTAIWLE